ncbi:MAG: cytochrome b/b6 domain-containing protein [Dehalococcoidales bacterium]|nr:cytochrome b/b6 domain-containing protein [Dehalococcoidales bacterium]
MTQSVEKYKKAVRVLHWVHTGAFLLLFLTGLVLFIPGLGFLAEDGWTRVFHRVGAVVFIIAPLVYTILDPQAVIRGLKQAVSWGKEDIEWLKAAPRYYFLNDESTMPPQGAMNTGQKMWWVITLGSGAVFILTGLIMWFAKGAAPPALMHWIILFHDVAFIAGGAMLFVHIYLAVFHPLMNEAWGSMINGKISVEYAKAHHGKWYKEVTGKKTKKSK